MVRALAFHQCGPGSNPGVDATCGLSLLLVLSFAARGFFPGTPVFPSPEKPTFPNSNSIRNQVDEEPLCRCATSKSKTLLDTGFQAMDSGFQVTRFWILCHYLGFRILIVSWIPEFLELYSRFQSYGIPDATSKSFPESGFPYMGRSDDSSLIKESQGLPPPPHPKQGSPLFEFFKFHNIFHDLRLSCHL